MPKKDGGPAFPIRERTEHIDGAIVCEEWNGMSLRDWFAGMALMGILNNAESRIFPMKHQEDKSNAEILAENCYFMADAMLKEREKEHAL